MLTTSPLWLTAMAETFALMGLPVKELFQQANIPLAALAKSSVRVPQDNVSALWQAAEAASGCDSLGMKVGSHISMVSVPVTAVALLDSNSPVAAIKLMLRYQKLIGEVADIRLVSDPSNSGAMTISHVDFRFFSDHRRPLSHHTLDAAMASMVRAARIAVGQQWRPKALWLRRSRGDVTELQEYYQCDIHSGQPLDAILLAPEDSVGNRPLLGAELGLDMEQGLERGSELSSELELRKTLDAYGDASLLAKSALSEVIAMALPDQLQSGDFKRQHMAQLLNMSERTLQRRLAAEGASYSAILDDVRRCKAEELLLTTSLSQTEVAFLCGFSDLSAFHHAFQRWFQQSPRQLREARQGDSEQ